MSDPDTATEIRTGSAEETEAVGERLAATLSRSDVVYLVGDLGAGKTTLARGLARGLGAETREVASPTFALLNEYAGAGAGNAQIVLRHLDLYRLADDPKDLAVLGLPDAAADAPVCVEWPGKAVRSLLPPTVEITIVPDGDARRIRVRRMRAEPGPIG